MKLSDYISKRKKELDALEHHWVKSMIEGVEGYDEEFFNSASEEDWYEQELCFIELNYDRGAN